MKDKISNHEDYNKVKHTRDTLSLLKIIKHLMYEEIHDVHNQVRVTINLLKMHQECHQSPQEIHDQFTVMRQVCKELGLKIGKSEQAARAVLKKDGVMNPTEEQIKEASTRY